ncbi:uncharacterized protein B0I36DRAFT_368795 [Microdochium trichocladiopsis]|uniref:Uncharacterized protein n=1 Tax=Microdochium trichocladiopsis TaxID=1682393 RepID=A0A9P9BGN1_9PEZI|nr:uncharacterized protein B0I36DRAFT_368795 [Microdochium trichocladiopsis]KAH7016207.1 hypothetical protein B0I36DRAFT_368795 [Microdochium trichocladiopsis]
MNGDWLINALSHPDGSGHPADEYATWVKDENALSNALQHLDGVNWEDTDLCTEKLFPCFKIFRAAIDSFLAHMMFTKVRKYIPKLRHRPGRVHCTRNFKARRLWALYATRASGPCNASNEALPSPSPLT